MIQETQPYDLGIIRKLLLAAFSAEELRRFCQDNPAFRPIVDRFGPAHGLDDMVDEVIAYCQTQLLLDQLLLHVREVNPRHYARFARDLGIPLAEAPPEVACPYRGLEPFEAEHAEFYFGREPMVETLLDRVRDHSFVAVVGPSGCGKSSLVRAGLVTALRAGALPGSERWRVCIFYPGADPLHALAAPLVDLLEPEASEVTRLREGRELADGLRQGTVLLADVAARLRQLRPGLLRLLLVADQFEELYSECGDEAARAAFVAALLAAAREKNVAVILTLRADFYGHVLANRQLGEAVDAGLANVLPMDETELRAAIEQPALRTGRAFEPGLVERIANDVASEPGNLPLLEFALTELWAWQTVEGLLTHEAYKAIGGVAGAIARRAEEEYADLAARGQGETVRRVLLRLTHYGETTAETRRRAMLTDLVTPRTPQAAVEATVRALADARLLVTGKEATVEVSHEALIRGWDRLRRWLDEDRAFGLWRERLAAARQTWQETGRDEGALLRGAPLAEAEGWLTERGDDLNEAERAFVVTSLALREREAAERDEQQRKEAQLAAEQRTAGRLRWLAVGLGVFVLVAVVLAGFALSLRGAAIRERGAAEQAQAEAEAAKQEIQRLLEQKKYLSEMGWGVIFPAVPSSEVEKQEQIDAVREALSELLDHRREQATQEHGNYYKEYIDGDGYRPGETVQDFLERHGVTIGPVDPGEVPYYLLIVGDPESVPYEFQYQLDVKYAVGRIHFETLEAYTNYAHSVVEAETASVRRPRQVSIFAVANEGDQAGRLSSKLLAEPLYEELKQTKQNWQVDAIIGDEATKARLAGLLGGDQTPAFLFTVSQGMQFPLDDPRQIPQEGALLCQDWPGPLQWRKAIPQDFFFAGDDVDKEARLLGLIVFSFASYSAGTPEYDDFVYRAFTEPSPIASHAFVARLPQRLLSHPNGGALAFIGHVEKIWGYSFTQTDYTWSLDEVKQVARTFPKALEQLLEGYPVGAAMEPFDQRYAELAAELTTQWLGAESGRATMDDYQLAALTTSVIDARNYVIVGDPAAHLMVGEDIDETE